MKAAKPEIANNIQGKKKLGHANFSISQLFDFIYFSQIEIHFQY